MTRIIKSLQENEMTKVSKLPKPKSSWLSHLWQIATDIIGGLKPFVLHIEEGLELRFDHYARLIEKRVMVLTLRGSALFMTLAFFGIGFLFVLIDYGGIPRGIACFGCGLLSLAVLLISVQFTK
jgi:hypothetical protein